jgi:hypothetical protein
LYSVKCNKHSILNSNSTLVYSEHNKWYPLNGLQTLNLPICSRICRFQARLTNGIIKIDSILNSTKQSIFYIDLIETSKIKYECNNGFHLRTIPTSRQTNNNINLKNRRILIEKCQSNGIQEFVIIKRKSNNQKVKIENNFEEYDYDSDYYADFDDNDYYAEKTSYSDHLEKYHNLNTNINNNNNNEKHLYECVKYCKQIKQLNIHNGYLVPSLSSTNNKIQFSPGEQIKFYCKEGYATDLTKTLQQVSNMHTLECSINGTWHLVLKSANKYPSALHSKEISQLSECITVDDIFKQNEKKGGTNNNADIWLTNSLSYSDLNMRTFTMIFAICGLIILILLTSLLTLKLLKRKQNEIVFNNLSPQLDPLLATNNSNNININSNNNDNNVLNSDSLPDYALRTREIPAINGLNLSSSINNCYLPSYQEAIQQPAFTASIANNLETQPSTSNQLNNKIEDLATQTTSQINPSAPNRSRSGSVRSNLTTRSGSIRTTNSIATTTSSFNIPMPSYSNTNQRASNSSKTTSSIRSKRTSQLNSNKRQQRTNRSNTTTTNISMLSNDTNASIKGLRGSTNGVDLVSNNSSTNLSNVGQLITSTTNNNEDESSKLNLDCNNDINGP